MHENAIKEGVVVIKLKRSIDDLRASLRAPRKLLSGLDSGEIKFIINQMYLQKFEFHRDAAIESHFRISLILRTNSFDS